MKDALRTTGAVILGLVCGGVVNMAIVLIGPSIVPPPPGADMTTVEGLTAAMPMLEAKHFLMPFLAHAMGTFVGALVAVLLTRTHRVIAASVIGVFFLAGGIAASRMIPAPTWFIVMDLVGAYLPMAWLGLLLAGRLKPADVAQR
ncbi:MAG: hypothetical protein KJZ74_03720 [Gemmatimonadales bacterium]|nr:hypothetical protein [Gemmatimonadota bacterium]MCL4213003.1 hypothetical protein [Gemmatimonadales bacterium]